MHLSPCQWFAAADTGVKSLYRKDCYKAELWFQLAQANENFSLYRSSPDSYSSLTRSNITWYLYRSQICQGTNTLPIEIFDNPRNICPEDSPLNSLQDRKELMSDAVRLIQGMKSTQRVRCYCKM